MFVRPSLSSGQKIETISMHIGEETYKMRNKLTQSEHIWSCTLKIPYKCLENNASFKICIEVISTSWTSLKLIKHHYEWESIPYVFTDATHERLVWNKCITENWQVAEHYKDILVNWSPISSLRECCMQIENFSKKRHLLKHDASKVYESLLESLEIDNPKHWLLLLVVVATIFKSVQMASLVLKEKEIKYILKSLSSFRVRDLTSLSVCYLPNYLKELCEAAHGDHSCFMMFVHATYPFLDEEVLLEMLNDVKMQRGKIVPSCWENSEKEILEAIGKLCKLSKGDAARQFLEKLLLSFPVVLAVKAYVYIRQSLDKSSADEVMLETIIRLLKSNFNSTQITVSAIANIWAIDELVSDLYELVTTEFESAMIQAIKKATDKEADKLKQLLLQTNTFCSTAQQIEIIECLASTGSTEQHLILFDILKDPKFMEAAERSPKKWFSLCLGNGILDLKRSGNREQMLKSVYKYFSIANEVPVVKNSESLQEILTITAIEFLRHLDLKMLLRSTKSIEELSANVDSVVPLFRKHFKAFLSSEQHSNYHEILLSLCGTSGEIRINSRYAS